MPGFIIMKLTKLAVGEPYPVKLTQYQDGAAAQFLLRDGNLLQILLSDISSDELWALKKGEIQAGFLYENGCILWLFKFLMKNKKNRIHS